MLNLDYIKSRRKELKITLTQMAELLGLSNASVYYKYESGIYLIKATTLPLLAEILKCDIRNFFKPNSSKTELLDSKSA